MFHIDQCPHDDVWPCPGGTKEGELKYEKSAPKPTPGSKVHMVDWTAARLCGTPCGNPLGVMNLDGSPPKGIEDQVMSHVWWCLMSASSLPALWACCPRLQAPRGHPDVLASR